LTPINFKSGNAHKGTVKEIVNKRFRSLQPIQTVRGNRMDKRIYIVLDALTQTYCMSWEKMALITVTEFARKYNMELGIITREHALSPVEFRKLLEYNQLQNYEKISFYSDCDRDVYGNIQYKLEVDEGDIFVATSWQSAVVVNQISTCKAFFYMHPGIVSDAENYWIKQLGNSYKGIEIVHDVVLPGHLCSTRDVSEKDKRILYYAGITAQESKGEEPYLGLWILDQAIQMGILNTKDWIIYYSGFEGTPVVFSNGYKAEKIEWNNTLQYRDFLAKVDITILFSDTNKYNYAIKEALRSGNIVFTNTNETLEQKVAGRLIYSDFNLDTALKNLEIAINMANTETGERIDCKNLDMLSADWDSALADLFQKMQENMQCIV
jgi:hypothetical protein